MKRMMEGGNGRDGWMGGRKEGREESDGRKGR